jgi:hypothetical protein
MDKALKSIFMSRPHNLSKAKMIRLNLEHNSTKFINSTFIHPNDDVHVLFIG